jgi:hypothetical protein
MIPKGGNQNPSIRSDITLPLGGNNDLECYEVVSMLLAEIVHRGNIMLNIE